MGVRRCAPIHPGLSTRMRHTATFPPQTQKIQKSKFSTWFLDAHEPKKPDKPEKQVFHMVFAMGLSTRMRHTATFPPQTQKSQKGQCFNRRRWWASLFLFSCCPAFLFSMVFLAFQRFLSARLSLHKSERERESERERTPTHTYTHRRKSLVWPTHRLVLLVRRFHTYTAVDVPGEGWRFGCQTEARTQWRPCTWAPRFTRLCATLFYGGGDRNPHNQDTGVCVQLRAHKAHVQVQFAAYMDAAHEQMLQTRLQMLGGRTVSRGPGNQDAGAVFATEGTYGGTESPHNQDTGAVSAT